MAYSNAGCVNSLGNNALPDDTVVDDLSIVPLERDSYGKSFY